MPPMFLTRSVAVYTSTYLVDVLQLVTGELLLTHVEEAHLVVFTAPTIEPWRAADMTEMGIAETPNRL